MPGATSPGEDSSAEETEGLAACLLRKERRNPEPKTAEEVQSGCEEEQAWSSSQLLNLEGHPSLTWSIPWDGVRSSVLTQFL